jgi:cytochrome c556
MAIRCGDHRHRAPRRRGFGLTPAVAFAAYLLAASLPAMAQDQDAATRDAIFARKTLMDFMCDRVTEIEVMVGRGTIDLKLVRQYADAMSAMFIAFPHLFPAGSNLWRHNPDADPLAETLASPDVWTGFPDFYQQAAESAKLARELARVGTADDARARARELRIACDACHALYLEDP